MIPTITQAEVLLKEENFPDKFSGPPIVSFTNINTENDPPLKCVSIDILPSEDYTKEHWQDYFDILRLAEEQAKKTPFNCVVKITDWNLDLENLSVSIVFASEFPYQLNTKSWFNEIKKHASLQTLTFNIKVDLGGCMLMSSEKQDRYMHQMKIFEDKLKELSFVKSVKIHCEICSTCIQKVSYASVVRDSSNPLLLSPPPAKKRTIHDVDVVVENTSSQQNKQHSPFPFK